jgi:predicted small lipoprotein YifL
MNHRHTPILLICLLLAACGQTGPLYLPEPETAPETAPEAEPEAAPETAPAQAPNSNPSADD